MRKFAALLALVLGPVGAATGQIVAPSVLIEPVDGDVALSGVARLSPIALTLTFSEAVQGLGEDDLFVSNGVVTGFAATADPLVWEVGVSPVDLGPLTILLPAGSVANAGGTGNGAAELTLTYDWRYPLDEESVSFQTLWTRPADFHLSMNTDGYNTQCASHGSHLYLVYYDTLRRIHLVKITEQGTQVQDVLLNDQFVATYGDYVARPDDHHRISIGVDEHGYIHLAGDMHNYDQVSGSSDHMPAVMRGGQCNYWRSDGSGDISSFTWLGDQPTRCPRFVGHTYMAFTYDANGHLYYYARGANDGHWTQSYRTHSISRYNSSTAQWEVVGGVNEFSVAHNSVLYATDGEEYDVPAPGTNPSRYSHIHGWLGFDRYNRMHVAAPILDDGGPAPPSGHYASHILYLGSDDFGDSFARADGTPVPVPAKVGQPGDPNRADLVFAVSQPVASEWLKTHCSVAADRFGTPFATFGDGASGALRVHGFNQTTAQWELAGNPLGLTHDDDMKLHADRLGVLTFVADGNQIHRTWNPNDPAAAWKTHAIPGLWNLRLDRRHFMLTGNLRGWKGNNGDLIEVVVTRPVPYPGPFDSDRDTMPDTWELAHGLNPADPSDAALDPDQDSFTSVQELAAGTDPHRAESVLRMGEMRSISPSQVEITWQSTLGRTYEGWFSEDLEHWTPVFTDVPGTPPSNSRILTVPAGSSTGFFRLGVQAP